MKRILTKREQEIRDALDKAWQIRGLYHRGEGHLLYRLARRRGHIVELGCWMGRTTSILVQAAGVWGADVTSVDAFVEMPSGIAQAGATTWQANLLRVGLVPPRLLAMTTDEAAPFCVEPIALLFIDADHSREGVARDLANWTPKVKLGGVVALHDMFFPSVTGVCQAVAEWWSAARNGQRGAWRLVGQRDFTIAFRRVA